MVDGIIFVWTEFGRFQKDSQMRAGRWQQKNRHRHAYVAYRQF